MRCAVVGAALLEDGSERPHLTSGPPPPYAAPRALAGIEGRGVLPAIVDPTGDVKAAPISVVERTDPRFTVAAKDSVLRAPGRMLGRAVRVRRQIPGDFRLPSRR